MTVLPVRQAIRAEQLRMVLDGIAQSHLVGFLLPTLLLGVLLPFASHA